MGYNYLSLPFIPACGAQVILYSLDPFKIYPIHQSFDHVPKWFGNTRCNTSVTWKSRAFRKFHYTGVVVTWYWVLQSRDGHRRELLVVKLLKWIEPDSVFKQCKLSPPFYSNRTSVREGFHLGYYRFVVPTANQTACNPRPTVCPIDTQCLFTGSTKSIRNSVIICYIYIYIQLMLSQTLHLHECTRSKWHTFRVIYFW